MPSALGKILVIRGGAIGDFVLTVPVLSALRQQFPEVRLELLGYPRVIGLAKAAGLVHAVESIDARPMASFFAKGGVLPAPLADYFSRFAVIISYLFDPDRIFQENVARASKAQFIVGPHRPEEYGDAHATEVFLQPLVRLAIFDADPEPKLRVPAGEEIRPELTLPELTTAQRDSHPLLRPSWLAIHPGSGSERKNWAEERWSELLSYLAAHSELRFLLIGGEAEGDRLGRLAAVLPNERVRVAQSLPLTEVAILLQQCWAYVGHDSGISHLAAAVGLPSIILWAPTRQQVWRPRGQGVLLLNSESGLSGLTVRAVIEALGEIR